MNVYKTKSEIIRRTVVTIVILYISIPTVFGESTTLQDILKNTDDSKSCPDKDLKNGLRKYFLDENNNCIKCPKCRRSGYGLSKACGNGLGINATCVKCKEGETYSEKKEIYSICKPCRRCDNTEEEQPCTIDQDRKCGKCIKCHFPGPFTPDICQPCTKESVNHIECWGCLATTSASYRRDTSPSQTPIETSTIYDTTTLTNTIFANSKFIEEDENNDNPPLSEKFQDKNGTSNKHYPLLSIISVLVIPISYYVYKKYKKARKYKSEKSKEANSDLRVAFISGKSDIERNPGETDRKVKGTSKRKFNRNEGERVSLTMSDHLNEKDETDPNDNSEASKTNEIDNQVETADDVFSDEDESKTNREKEIVLNDEEINNCSSKIKDILDNFNFMHKLSTLMDKKCQEVRCLSNLGKEFCNLDHKSMSYINNNDDSQTKSVLEKVYENKPNTKIIEILVSLSNSERNDVVDSVLKLKWHSNCSACLKKFNYKCYT